MSGDRPLFGMSARCSYIDWPPNRKEDRRAFLLTFPSLSVYYPLTQRLLPTGTFLCRSSLRSSPARQLETPNAGACGGGRASKRHGVAPGRIRRLHRGLPARRIGVRIKQRPVRDVPDGPGDHGHREVRLRERFSILAVPGIRPGRPADTSRGRCLVRPARWRGYHPCPGLARGRPPWRRCDSPIWPGHPPRRPRTRPDMAGRRRQLVFLTRAFRVWWEPQYENLRCRSCGPCIAGRGRSSTSGPRTMRRSWKSESRWRSGQAPVTVRRGHPRAVTRPGRAVRGCAGPWSCPCSRRWSCRPRSGPGSSPAGG